MDVTETVKDWVSDPGLDPSHFPMSLLTQLALSGSAHVLFSLPREQPRPEAGRPLSLLHLRPVHQQHSSQQK